MKCVVTGGAGFIGSHLVDALVEEGHEVTVLDKKKSKNQAVTSIQEDLLRADLDKVFEGKEVVFHLAALISVPESIKHPEKYHEVNATGTLKVLEAARRASVKKVIFSSSAAVYGDSEPPCKEDAKGKPLSPYALSKHFAEQYCEYYYTQHGLQAVSLRYFNVYGPGQSADSAYASVIPKFIKQIKEGKAPVIYGDGKQTRDFIYVGDVVKANLLAAKSELKGQVINIGSGKPVTIKELASIITKSTDEKTKPEHADARLGDILHSHADITKAKTILGYIPEIELEEGICKTI